ncbi:MAG: transcriptional regulator [Desulfobacterales bacterium S7086C20]|nr:P-II family nitrogen regulator [Deltaproteobacteria bacterium]OEU45888.1 MAG: transcriptional regulator [Desulfobacterales bacterium S7086C20]
MKLITAIIREEMLDQVREALIAAKIERITVCRVSGHGNQKTERVYRGTKVIPNLIPKVRMDIAVNDPLVEITCDTIIDAAGGENPEIGAGKIFITNLEGCIRIRTREQGEQAM